MLLIHLATRCYRNYWFPRGNHLPEEVLIASGSPVDIARHMLSFCFSLTFVVSNRSPVFFSIASFERELFGRRAAESMQYDETNRQIDPTYCSCRTRIWSLSRIVVRRFASFCWSVIADAVIGHMRGLRNRKWRHRPIPESYIQVVSCTLCVSAFKCYGVFMIFL